MLDGTKRKFKKGGTWDWEKRGKYNKEKKIKEREIPKKIIRRGGRRKEIKRNKEERKLEREKTKGRRKNRKTYII